MTMSYLDHLKQFYGSEIDEAELTSLALHAVATDIRATKPAIASCVWQARQGVEQALGEARMLTERYNAALSEYRNLIAKPVKKSDPGEEAHDSDSTV